MAKGFKHGAGGASPLNLKIIGNPKPQTAKENTIWIDTDVKITSWIFSATEPDPPADGKDGPVWIYTGASSHIAFSATKKNPIMVYPISAKQYVSGTWVDKTAKSYQGGAWVDWMVYLYNAGDTCDAITGGWDNFGTKNQFYPDASGVTGVTAMALNTLSNSSQNWAYAATKSKINLTPFSILRARVSGGGWAEGFARIGYSNQQSGFTAYKAAVNDQEQTIELDISGVKGEWYILFGSNMCQSNAYNYCYEVILL